MKKVSKAPAKNKKPLTSAKKASAHKAMNTKRPLEKVKADKNRKDIAISKGVKSSKKPETKKVASLPKKVLAKKTTEAKKIETKKTDKKDLKKTLSNLTKKIQEKISTSKKKQEEKKHLSTKKTGKLESVKEQSKQQTKSAVTSGKNSPVLTSAAAKGISYKNETKVAETKEFKKVKSKDKVIVGQKVDSKSDKNQKSKNEAKLSASEKNKDKKKKQVKGGKHDDLELEGFEENQDELKSRSGDEEDDDDFEKLPIAKPKMVFDKEEDLEEDFLARKKIKTSGEEDIKDLLAEEILSLAEDFSINEIFTSIRNMELFKIETDECVVRGCDNPATTSGYCRYHYIKLWKDIQKKQLILSEGRLAKIIEDLVGKYPIKFIESIVQDLADDKAFNSVLKDLDIETDEAEMEGFDDDELLDDDQDIAFETKVVKPSFDD